MSVSIRVDRIPVEIEKKLTMRYLTYTRDFNWILENMESLIRDFPDTYIAVKEHEVKYWNKNVDKLISKIKDDGNDIDDYVIEFITTQELKFLF